MFETFIKLILHIKVCWFFLDDSPHSQYACIVGKAYIPGCSYRDNTQRHTTKNTLLKCYVLGFQRAIHQPDLALLDIVYFQKLKTYLRRSRFNYRTEISHAIQKYNRPLNNAWFIHVYIELGEILSVLHIRVSTLRRRIVACDNNYHDVSRRCYDVVVRRFWVHGVIKFFVKSLFFLICSVRSCVFDQGVEIYVSEICKKVFIGLLEMSKVSKYLVGQPSYRDN